MMQVGGGRDLAQKALGPEGVDQLGTEDLYGYLAIMLEVMREIDRSHPACAKLAVEPVAIGQGVLKSGLKVGQVGRQRESVQTWFGGDLLASRAALKGSLGRDSGKLRQLVARTRGRVLVRLRPPTARAQEG